jgi:Spy/CpxP family protein refolding chaperone
MKRVLPFLAAMTVAFTAFPALGADETAPAITGEVSAQDFIAQAPAGGLAQIQAQKSAERAALRLTDSQIEQLRSLKDKYFADNTTKRAQLKILKNQLRGEMSKENVDRSSLLGLQAKINALQADISNNRINMMADASQVFTPEQRKAMHSRRLHHGGGFGRGGKRHHGKSACGGGRHGGKGGKHGFGGPRGERFRGGPGGPGGPGAGPASIDLPTQTPPVEG